MMKVMVTLGVLSVLNLACHMCIYYIVFTHNTNIFTAFLCKICIFFRDLGPMHRPDANDCDNLVTF